MNDYASGCIHLKACRRCAKIYKARNGRACNADTCSAYISGDDNVVITVDIALEFARNGAYLIRGGLDEYDAYAPQDLVGECLGDYINDIYEEGEL